MFEGSTLKKEKESNCEACLLLASSNCPEMSGRQSSGSQQNLYEQNFRRSIPNSNAIRTETMSYLLVL
jgi:hypothetical protein